MVMRAIGTGNPRWGLAKHIANHVAADWCSKSNGWDLYDPIRMIDFAVKTLDYDVFINNSKLDNFQQTRLLKEVANTWLGSDKSGLIINIGSTADVARYHTGFYPAEKAALYKYSNQLHHYFSYRKGKIRSTMICPGVIDIESTSHKVGKINPDTIGKMVAWVIQQPSNINIECIRFDPQE
jgi:NAD(P)-dependent dehydrogenase (short-subunit alcohol dehydrogenase family)